MQKCKHADAYRAERPPRCNGGRGCDVCNLKWNGKRQARARLEQRMHLEQVSND
jgi:hypothetical protein